MNLPTGKKFLERRPQLNQKEYKYRIDHYDYFYQTPYAFKGSFFFATIEKAEIRMKEHAEAQKKWPETFDNDDYVLVEIESNSIVKIQTASAYRNSLWYQGYFGTKNYQIRQ